MSMPKKKKNNIVPGATLRGFEKDCLFSETGSPKEQIFGKSNENPIQLLFTSAKKKRRDQARFILLILYLFSTQRQLQHNASFSKLGFFCCVEIARFQISSLWYYQLNIPTKYLQSTKMRATVLMIPEKGKTEVIEKAKKSVVLQAFVGWISLHQRHLTKWTPACQNSCHNKSVSLYLEVSPFENSFI